MAEDRSFYVYEHWRPDKDVCFYVGKGRKKRAWVLKGRRNKYHEAVVSKLTSLGLCVDVRVIASDLLEETAFALERDRIAFYGRKNLVNMTDGGEGTVGLSEEARKVMSQKATGNKRNLGRIWSEESRKKVGDNSRGNTYRRGKTHSDDTKRKLSAIAAANIEEFNKYAHLGPAALARSVICVNDGCLFMSASEAARYYGVSRSALIELCLGKNGRKTVGGMVFAYKDVA